MGLGHVPSKCSTLINVDLKDDYLVVKTMVDVLDIKICDFVRAAVANHISLIKKDPEYLELVEQWKIRRQLLEKEIV